MSKLDKAAARDSRREFFVVFAVFFVACAVRFLYCGPQYYHQLDDYIQYYNYANLGDGLGDLIGRLGLLSARPLAGLADILVWSRMYDFMWLAMLIMAGLLAASGALLHTVLRRHFNAGPMLLVVLCLMPLGFEGTYWISASSRVVCGLFFAALSAWFLQRFAETSRLRDVVLFAVTQLLCFGFYEQAILLSLGLTLLLVLLNGKQLGIHRLWGLLSLVNLGVLALVTSIAGQSALYSGRMAIVWPNSQYYYSEFLPVVLGQFKSAFLGAGFFTTTRGLVRGVKQIFADVAIWYLLIALLAAAAVFLLAHRSPGPRGRHFRGLPSYALCGLALAVLPVLPFLFLDNPWFSLRNTVMSLVGVGMMLDAGIAGLSGLMGRRGPALRAGMCAAVTLVFMLASVSEISDYRLNHEYDQRVLEGLEAIAPQMDELADIALVNVNPTYLAEQNAYYHEHIHGVTESDWALSGAIRAHLRRETGFMLTPLRTDGMLYRPFDRMGEYQAFFFMEEDFSFTPVTYSSAGGAEAFLRGDGAVAAYVERHANGGVQVVAAEIY